MPTLARLPQSRISMYATDHQPPHCHIRANDGREALIDITRLQVLRGQIDPRALAEAMHWIQANQAELLARFKEFNP